MRCTGLLITIAYYNSLSVTIELAFYTRFAHIKYTRKDRTSVSGATVLVASPQTRLAVHSECEMPIRETNAA